MSKSGGTRPLHVSSIVAFTLFLVAPASIRPVITELFGWFATIAVVVATRRFPRRERLPWILLWVAGFASLAGGVAKFADLAITGVAVHPPSIADPFFALTYISILGCELMLIRARTGRGERGHLLDAVLPGASAALALWAFVLQPYVTNPAHPLPERIVNLAYALVSLAILTSTLRLAVGNGARPRSYHLLAGAVSALLVSDLMVTVAIARGVDSTVNQYLTIPIFALMAAAATHPSAPAIISRPLGERTRLTRRRVSLLGASLLLPPVVLLASLTRTDRSVLTSVIIGYALIALLVLGRIVALVRSEEAVNLRQQTLRETGQQLLTAMDDHEVEARLRDGVGRLLHDHEFSLEIRRGERASPDAHEWTGGDRHRLQFPLRSDADEAGSDRAGLVEVVVDRAPDVDVSDAVAILAQEAGLALHSIAMAGRLVRQQAERRFQALIDNASDIVAVVDDAGRVSFVSPAASRLLGFPSELMVDHPVRRFVHPDDLDGAVALLRGTDQSVEIRLRHATGTYHWFEVQARDLLRDPAIGGVVVNARHIGDRKRAEQLLQRSESRFRALVQNSSDVVIVVDVYGEIGYASPAVEELLGLTPDRATGVSLSELVSADRLIRHLADAERNTGELPTIVVEAEALAASPRRVIEFTVSDLRHESGVEGIVLNGRDVTDRRGLERSLRHQALHDHLTGLPNRTLLMARAEEALATVPDSPVALLFLDLDDFKDVNDSLGHEAGDQLLSVIAERLTGAIRAGDTAARIGGDEFAVLLPYALGETAVLQLCDRITTSLAQPVIVGGRAVNCTVSIGVALDHDRTSTPEVLLRNGDVAMYRAKERGKGRVEVFEEHLHTTAFHRFEVRTELKRAIAGNELRLFYQPVIDLDTSGIIGAEALVRWEHPTKGLLSPADFIPVAEATGLIVPLGAWVMEEAIDQLGRWNRELGVALDLSVNVSVRQLEQRDLVEGVLASLIAAEVRNDQLTIEITESVIMSDPHRAAAQFGELRAEGIRIAVDDFGTGYSSLTQVQDFPFDVLKIDKSFVDRLVDGPNRAAPDGGVIRTIMGLARDLGATTVAEGIEHAAQLRRLRELGCRLGQGYYFSRPIPPTDFAALVLAERGVTAGAALDGLRP